MTSGTILVTGANGFIGPHLVQLLRDKGRRVRGMILPGDKPKFESGHNGDFEWVWGDLKDPRSLRAATKDCGLVFHLAALSRNDPRLQASEYYRVNVEGTRSLLEASRDEGVKRFVYASSNEAVGLSQTGEVLNEETVPHPPNVYGQSKLEAEGIVQTFNADSGMETVIVRPYTTYGPGGRLTFRRYFMPIRKGFFAAFGNGEALMEFAYVKNQAYGFWLAAQNGKPGQIYCLSDPRSYSYKEIAHEIAAQMGIRLRLFYIPYPLAWIFACLLEGLSGIFHFVPFYMKDTGRPLISRQTLRWAVTGGGSCSIEKARKELGYEPPYSLRQGLQETIQWFAQQGTE